MTRRSAIMLESLIIIQAMLSNVNGAAISRSLSSSIVAANQVMAINSLGVSPVTTGRFSQPYSGKVPLHHFQHAPQQRNCFASPGWHQRVLLLPPTSRSCSTSSMLFATRGGGGDTHDESSQWNFSTKAEQQDIELPFRKYGYRSTPFSWEELHHIIVQEQNLAKLSRSVAQEQDYQRALGQLRQEWKSTKDYILHTKFNLPKRLDKESQLYSVDEEETPPGAATNQGGQHETLRRIVPNDFPYFCEPGIAHWVLWKYGTNSEIATEDIDWAIKELSSLIPPSSADDGSSSSSNILDQSNVIYWENPPNLKSLPEISHVHILLRDIPKQ